MHLAGCLFGLSILLGLAGMAVIDHSNMAGSILITSGFLYFSGMYIFLEMERWHKNCRF